MTSAALPAAESSDTSIHEHVRLKLVQPSDELVRTRYDKVREKSEASDDLDDLWDNLPV